MRYVGCVNYNAVEYHVLGLVTIAVLEDRSGASHLEQNETREYCPATWLMDWLRPRRKLSSPRGAFAEGWEFMQVSQEKPGNRAPPTAFFRAFR